MSNSISEGDSSPKALIAIEQTTHLLTFFFAAVMSSVLGSAIVIAGLYILLWGKKKDAEDCSKEPAKEAEEVKDQEVP